MGWGLHFVIFWGIGGGEGAPMGIIAMGWHPPGGQTAPGIPWSGNAPAPPKKVCPTEIPSARMRTTLRPTA